MSEERAVATLLAAFDSPVRFLDTSNGYGPDGEAERRIGAALRSIGGVPKDFVVATKVDPDPESGDFSGDRVRVSLRESLQRMGVARLPLLYLHDPERIGFDAAVAPDGPVDALRSLREEGHVEAIGVAGGSVDLMRRLLDTGVFDVVLTHNRYTLLDRSAEDLIAYADAAGLGVVNAAPYGGGLLSNGPAATSSYAYSDDPAAQASALEMDAACRRHGVPLAAAALQFSLRDSRISSTVVGISAPQRVTHTLALAAHPIPEELWEALDALTPPPDRWLTW